MKNSTKVVLGKMAAIVLLCGVAGGSLLLAFMPDQDRPGPPAPEVTRPGVGITIENPEQLWVVNRSDEQAILQNEAGEKLAHLEPGQSVTIPLQDGLLLVLGSEGEILQVVNARIYSERARSLCK